MKIFNREMGGGKTTALLELMARPENRDVIYVAPTLRQAESAWRMYEAMFQEPTARDRFVKLDQVTSRHPGGQYPAPRYVLDEVDGLLPALVGGPVVGIAGTDEDLRAGQAMRMSEGR